MVAVLAVGACSGNSDPRFFVGFTDDEEPSITLTATSLLSGGRYVVEEI